MSWSECCNLFRHRFWLIKPGKAVGKLFPVRFQTILSPKSVTKNLDARRKTGRRRMRVHNLWLLAHLFTLKETFVEIDVHTWPENAHYIEYSKKDSSIDWSIDFDRSNRRFSLNERELTWTAKGVWDGEKIKTKLIISVFGPWFENGYSHESRSTWRRHNEFCLCYRFWAILMPSTSTNFRFFQIIRGTNDSSVQPKVSLQFEMWLKFSVIAWPHAWPIFLPILG